MCHPFATHNHNVTIVVNVSTSDKQAIRMDCKANSQILTQKSNKVNRNAERRADVEKNIINHKPELFCDPTKHAF